MSSLSACVKLSDRSIIVQLCTGAMHTISVGEPSAIATLVVCISYQALMDNGGHCLLLLWRSANHPFAVCIAI